MQITSVDFCAVSGDNKATFVNPSKKAKDEDLRGNGSIWILSKGIREPLLSGPGHELFELTVFDRQNLEKGCTY